jgi:hypothetical protein
MFAACSMPRLIGNSAPARGVRRIEVARYRIARIDARRCRSSRSSMKVMWRRLRRSTALRRRLALLGDAGPDEDDRQLVAVELPQRPRDGDHRRDDRREHVDDVGVVAFDVRDDRGAGRGDVTGPGSTAVRRRYSAATRSPPPRPRLRGRSPARGSCRRVPGSRAHGTRPGSSAPGRPRPCVADASSVSTWLGRWRRAWPWLQRRTQLPHPMQRSG